MGLDTSLTRGSPFLFAHEAVGLDGLQSGRSGREGQNERFKHTGEELEFDVQPVLSCL